MLQLGRLKSVCRDSNYIKRLDSGPDTQTLTFRVCQSVTVHCEDLPTRFDQASVGCTWRMCTHCLDGRYITIDGDMRGSVRSNWPFRVPEESPR